ncbi:MAG: hypothetical protein SGPRY_014381, partial [Prymnesium sp.]
MAELVQGGTRGGGGGRLVVERGELTRPLQLVKPEPTAEALPTLAQEGSGWRGLLTLTRGAAGGGGGLPTIARGAAGGGAGVSTITRGVA